MMNGSIAVNDVHSVHRATEISDHFYASVKGMAKHDNGLQCDSWILLSFLRYAGWLTLTAILDFSDSKSAHS